MHDGFTVHLAKSNVDIKIFPGQSILRALLDVGYEIDYMCEAGVCGCCTVKILSGKVEHKDEILTDEEKVDGNMQVCVSLPLPGEKLIIDL